MTVKVRCPIGVTVVMYKGMKYEADIYGDIQVPQNIAEEICKDKRYCMNLKRDGVRGTATNPIADAVAAQVVKDTQAAEDKTSKLN